MMQEVNAISLPNATGIVEILVMAIVLYYIMDFFRGTRSAQVMSGFIFFLIALTALTRFFHLDALNWILQRISVYAAVAFLVIFQPEIIVKGTGIVLLEGKAILGGRVLFLAFGFVGMFEISFFVVFVDIIGVF